MKIIHYTSADRMESIIKNGLKTGSDHNLTEPLGVNNNIMYSNRFGKHGLYFAIEDNIGDNVFAAESDYGVEVNLLPDDLVADVQMLVDYGAVFDEDFEYFWFDTNGKKVLNFIEKYDILGGEISVDEALDGDSFVCDLLKELTGTGVYMNDLSSKAIKSIKALPCRANYKGLSTLNEGLGKTLKGAELVNSDRFLYFTKFKDYELEKLIKENSPESMRSDRFILFRNIHYYYNEKSSLGIIHKSDRDMHYVFELNKNPEILLNTPNRKRKATLR